MNRIAQRVYDLAMPIAQQQGVEIWDVEYLREAGQWFLRVYIDKDGGIGIDDCEALSRALDPVLDEQDLIPDSYVFEVSSAGAERQLKRASDFERFIGSNVEVKLYKSFEGRKEYVGRLLGYDEGAVTIECAGRELTFAGDAVAQVRLRIV
jgi:ribosome maturation factor RimP